MSTLFMRIEKYTLFSMGTQIIYFHFVIKDRKPYQQSTTLFKGKLHTWKREFVEIVYFAHKLKQPFNSQIFLCFLLDFHSVFLFTRTKFSFWGSAKFASQPFQLVCSEKYQRICSLPDKTAKHCHSILKLISQPGFWSIYCTVIMYFIFVVSFFIVDIFQYHVTEIFTNTSVILAFDKSRKKRNVKTRQRRARTLKISGNINSRLTSFTEVQ